MSNEKKKRAQTKNHTFGEKYGTKDQLKTLEHAKNYGMSSERLKEIMDLAERYDEMVMKLSQPNADCIKKMQASEKAHLVHMVLGICGEYTEVVDSVDLYKAGLSAAALYDSVKELGDLLFYTRGAIVVMERYNDKITVPSPVSCQTLRLTGEIAEVTKKLVMYDESDLAQKLYDLLKLMEAHIRTMGNSIGVDIETIMLENFKKLEKRYGKDMQYTDAAAIAKADQKE